MGTDRGVHGGTRVHVYPARPRSAPCASLPGAYGTSPAALSLSPVAKRQRGGER